MYGGWYDPEPLPPKSFPKAVVDARGEDGLKALNHILAKEVKAQGKPLQWVLEGDAYVLRDA